MNNVEIEVLLTISSRKFSFSMNQKLCSLISNSDFDWNYFAQRSIDTLLAPVIFRNVKSSNELLQIFPESVLESFSKVQTQIIVKNSFLQNEFEKIIKAFNFSGVDVMPLKGIFLLNSHYKDFSLRQISDIDLLVRESQLEEACHYFLMNGFEMEMYMPATAAKISKTPAPYKFSKNGLVVDLHIGLTYIYDNCNFEIQKLWSRSKKNDFGYFEMNSLDHLLFLFAHLMKHIEYRNCKLINFYDILLILETDKIHIESLFELSSQCDCENDVKDIMYLFKEYFKVDSFNSFLQDYVSKRNNIDEIFKEIAGISRSNLELKYAPKGSTGFKPIPYLTFANKVKYVLSRIFPDVKYIKCTYGKCGGFLLNLYLRHLRTITPKFSSRNMV